MPQNIVLLPTRGKIKPLIAMYGSLVVLRCLENSLVEKTGYKKNGYRIGYRNKKWRHKKSANSYCYYITILLQVGIQRPFCLRLQCYNFLKANSNATGDVLWRSYSKKFFKIYRKTHLCWVSLYLEMLLKVTPAVVFSCKFWEFIQDTHLVEHFKTAASDREFFLKTFWKFQKIFKSTMHLAYIVLTTIVKESSHKLFN